MKQLVRVAVCAAVVLLLGMPLTGATSTTSGVVIITQSAVLKGGIPGTNTAVGFPVTITAPGSYRLGSDLNVPAGVDGIDIQARDVTLDLNGFTIRGPVTCKGNGPTLSCSGSTAGNGVSSFSANVTVKNGTVRGFASVGVGVSGLGSTVDQVKTSENMVAGINVTYGLVTNSTANRNGFSIGNGFGIGGINSQLRGNSANNNSGDGFSMVASGATENVATGNGGYGFDGAMSLISNNTSSGNHSGDFLNQGGLTSPNTNSCSGSQC